MTILAVGDTQKQDSTEHSPRTTRPGNEGGPGTRMKW